MSEEWHPHPKQEQALLRTEFEVLYGGSRGGGKTDAGLVWLTYGIENPRYRALVIRKNAEDLSDWVNRATRFYAPMGATIVSRPAVITFPSGAIIRTGHLKDDQAYTKYQGHEYQRMLIEELTQIPDERRYLQLLSSCRSTVPGLHPQVFSTTNPGGPGHGWVKRRFVDPSAPEVPFLDKTSGRSRIFVPATIDDNPTLTTNDPDYVKFLDSLKDSDIELWKAWRLGDWSTFSGQFFREWRTDKHVSEPLIPRKDLTFVAGLDWGRVAPFAMTIAAVQTKTWEGVKFHRIWVFAELYGTDKTPKEWGQLFKDKIKWFGLKLSNFSWIQADTQIFTVGNDKSKSIRDQFIDCDEEFRRLLKPASKDRIGGWENVHNWLSDAPDEEPYMIFTNNCVESIRSIPELIHDDIRVEDVNSDSDDHLADALRYMTKALKWLDAKSGGVSHQSKARKVFTANTVDGKQIAISTDKWAISTRHKRKYN